MNKYKKMKRKTPKCETKNFSDMCTTALFTVFIFTIFLLMFSYAENFSPTIESVYRMKIKENKFSVKQYTWKCSNDKCVRSLYHTGERISLETCKMMCAQPAIWPKLRNLTITSKKSSTIDVENINFDLPKTGDAIIMLRNATNLFLKNLEFLKPTNWSSTPNSAKLTVHVVLRLANLTKLKLNTNESYHLLVQEENGNVSAYISSENFFGARHALETLSQLIWFDEVSDSLQILHDVEVRDFPEFPYRGVMIDTARNFFPVSLLKKILDGMGTSKLNVLHLHLTDAVSFPIFLPRAPQLAEYGAYGPGMVYSPADIKDLIQYARVRGVRVHLEIDAPSHVNAGWNYAKELFNEDYVICGQSDVFNGHLNPDNDNALKVLESVYKDLLELTGDDEIFHIGSDEVNLDCWRHTNAAVGYTDMKQFWLDYTNKMLERLKKANNGTFPEKIVIWSSPLTDYYHFDKLEGNVVVQFWLGRPDNFLLKGNSVIYSTVGHWYLDCGFGPWKPDMYNGVCDPYTPWQTFYKYRPWKEFGHRELTLGGEVCLWTEQVDVDTLETRVWPRAAAFAERVWSDPGGFDDYDVYTRLVSFRDRMMKRGIPNAGMWPRWCSLNPGKC